MSYERRTVEITLERVNLGKVAGGSRGSKHLLTLSLVYPRPAIAEKVALKTIAPVGGVFDLAEKSWTERILFKETVQGPFGLCVDVSEAMSDSVLGRVVDSLAGTLLKAAAAEAGVLGAGLVTAGLARAPLEYLSKAAALSQNDAMRSLGVGRLDLEADAGWAAGSERRVSLPLIAQEDLYQVSRTRAAGSFHTRRRRLARKGDVGGEVSLALRVYD